MIKKIKYTTFSGKRCRTNIAKRAQH